MTTAPLERIDRVEWDEFTSKHLDWRQGEHVTMIGPTGAGKTTLALALLPLRSYVLVLASKPHDDTMSGLIKNEGYRRVKRWKDLPPIRQRKTLRAVLWPPYRTARDSPTQAYEFDLALDEAFAQGGWCVFVDELFTAKRLGLEPQLEAYWTQGRSLGLSLIAGSQRPAFIPLMAYDQATHLFFWRDNDERNLKRISGMNGINAKLIRETVATMPRHDTLYANTRTGAMVMTRAPRGK